MHPHNCSCTYLFIDELAEVALVLLPFLLSQKRSKANQEDFVRFVSVRVYFINYIMYIIIFNAHIAVHLKAFFEDSNDADLYSQRGI